MWIINLIIDAVPFWVWLVIAGVVLALTAQFWLPLWNLLPRPVRALVVGTGAVIAAYGFGRNKGFRNARERQRQADANAIKNRLDVSDEVAKLKPEERDARLEKYYRD